MQKFTDKEVFNQRFRELNSDKEQKDREVVYDRWLADYEEEIEKCHTPIVDLGCGLGNNVLYLIEKGKEVLACDYSDVAIETIKKEIPKAQTKLLDLAEMFPIEDNFTEVVIADLSIHYFTKEVTRQIIGEIKRILKPNGIFLFRVNSTKDKHFNTMENAMEKGFLWEEREQKSKRCFDQNSIREFFADWKQEKIKEETMLRYGKEKILWNCAVRKG